MLALQALLVPVAPLDPRGHRVLLVLLGLADPVVRQGLMRRALRDLAGRQALAVQQGQQVLQDPQGRQV